MTYLEELSAQLPLTAGLYGLDIAGTEALTALASTVTESLTQSSIPKMMELLNGLRDLPTITNREAAQDTLIVAALQAQDRVRYAAVVRKAGRIKGIAVYLGR